MSKNSGFSFTGLLTIAFIVLKLCKVIDWNWLWVVSPIWIFTAAIILIVILIYTVQLITRLYLKTFNKEKYNKLYQIFKEKEANRHKSKWQIKIEEIQKVQQKIKQMKNN